MMKIKFIKNLIIMTALSLFINNNLIQCQNINTNNNIEAQKCTQYKKELFEIERSFIPLIHDAEEIKFTEDNCREYSPLVVGGTPALPKEFPHAARLGYFDDRNRRTSWLCGGTLITSKFILSAAHCFYPNFGVINRVRLGELDFSTDQDDAQPIDYTIKRYIEHPEYNVELKYYDIGLVETVETIEFNSYIHPACLPLTSGHEFKDFIAIGWGSTKFASRNSEFLLKVKLQYFDYDRCRRFTDGEVSSDLNRTSQICAGSNESKDTCNGDSGGPLLAYHKDYPCMYYIVGITSYGINDCGQPGVPAVYTHVYHYMNWIKQYIWKGEK